MYPFVTDGKRICDNSDYGKHIVLRCKNHPEKTWSTKNIAYIGCRSLFYNLYNDPKQGQECDCSIRELYHDHKDDK